MSDKTMGEAFTKTREKIEALKRENGELREEWSAAVEWSKAKITELIKENGELRDVTIPGLQARIASLERVRDAALPPGGLPQLRFFIDALACLDAGLDESDWAPYLRGLAAALESTATEGKTLREVFAEEEGE